MKSYSHTIIDLTNTNPNNKIIECNRKRIKEEYEIFKNKYQNCKSLETFYLDKTEDWIFSSYSPYDREDNTSYNPLLFNHRTISIMVFTKTDSNFIYSLRIFVKNPFFFNSKEKISRLLNLSNWNVSLSIKENK